jgi:hypothetical protein
MITLLCVNIEERLAQLFDMVQQDPTNVNSRLERIVLEYMDKLGLTLERYYKLTQEPQNNIIQQNITLQMVDQHIVVFHDVIKKVLSEMDVTASVIFLEKFSEEMSKLKKPNDQVLASTESRLAEAKILNETISKKLQE